MLPMLPMLTMRARSSIFVLVSIVAGLASAQPPVPLYGAGGGAPDESLGATGPSFGAAAGVGVDVDDASGAPEPAPLEEAVDAASQAAEAAKERADRLAAELDGLVVSRRAAELRLRQRARALYRIRRGGSIPLSGGFDALLARVGRLERLEHVLVDDARRVTQYKRREHETSAELTRARTTAASAEERRSAAETQRRAFEAQLGYAEAGLGYGALPGLAVAPMPTPGPDVYAPEAAAATAPTSGFALLRGRLGLPLTTSIGMRDAVRDDGPGVEFLARPGTTVMAVAEGRIAFAGDYGSYGRMVIVDHGDTFYTIYAGLGRITARVGDWMARGAAIGEVAGGANAALFFEVRRGTRSLDTRNWIGIAR